jgi:hypothetical protein
MEDFKKALAIVATLVVVVIVGAFVWTLLEDVGPPRPVTVKVTLVNKCELTDEVFMVKVMPHGATAVFHNKVAVVEAMSNQRVKLVANSKYHDFQFEGDEDTAAPSMTLTAHCDSNSRFDSTAKSMRKAFD